MEHATFTSFIKEKILTEANTSVWKACSQQAGTIHLAKLVNWWSLLEAAAGNLPYSFRITCITSSFRVAGSCQQTLLQALPLNNTHRKEEVSRPQQADFQISKLAYT